MNTLLNISTTTMEIISAISEPSENTVVKNYYTDVQNTNNTNYSIPKVQKKENYSYIDINKETLIDDKEYITSVTLLNNDIRMSKSSDDLESLVSNSIEYIQKAGILTVDPEKDLKIDQYFSKVTANRKVTKIKFS